VISFDWVVRISIDGVQRGWQLLVQDAPIGGPPVGRHLDRSYSHRECPSAEPPGCGEVATGRDHNVDGLAELVDCPVHVCPATGDLDVRLVDEPAVTRQPQARPGSFNPDVALGE
jgi:hypothetical protein